jgi:dTDP-D-glucose 4,6-dehydratase
LNFIEVIPKFTCLLQRGDKMMIHGDGKHSRRYVYAGDAADALDTILHKGKYGETYNTGSLDEVSNFDLCFKLCRLFGLPHSTQKEVNHYLTHVKDRPFNDRRYAINSSKLMSLGWSQRTPFEEGLRNTVAWYRKYGETWWGDISASLTPYPRTGQGLAQRDSTIAKSLL